MLTCLREQPSEYRTETNTLREKLSGPVYRVQVLVCGKSGFQPLKGQFINLWL